MMEDFDPREEEDTPPPPGDDQPDQGNIEHWKHLFVPMSEVKAKPPEWVIPGLLVPGLNILVAPPKNFKSTLVMEILASCVMRQPVAGDPKKISKRKGPVVYFAAEQSPSTLRNMLDKRILRAPWVPKGVSWDFVLPRNAWRWQIDLPEGEYDMEQFIYDWKPMVLVLDPLIRFHSQDENSPAMIKPLIPLHEAMLKHKGALVVVHHTNKGKEDQNGGGKKGPSIATVANWDRARGTSALWGMADAGIMLQKIGPGSVAVYAEFKDYPAMNWTWRVPK